jgi:hypothetical protein
MTKDDIMKLALESGFAKILDEHASEYRDFTFELSQDHYPELERFANLVAAAEREACAAICEEEEELRDHTPFDCARAIRARGNT